MGTKAGVGYANDTSSMEAGVNAAKAALAEAGVDAPDLAILFATSKHDPVKLRDGVRSVVGDKCRLVGGYAIGMITSKELSYGGYEVGIAVVKSDTMKVDMFIETGLADDERTVGKALGEQIKKQEYRGDPNVFMMYDSVKGQGPGMALLNLATPLIEGIGDSLGTWPPFAGIGMLGDMQFNPTHQWFDDEIYQQAAIALVLSGGVRMDTVIMHGCKPSGGYHTVTKADANVVLEIDGVPALDMIDQMLGGLKKSWEDYPLFVTLGVNKADKFAEFKEEDYANRLCMAVDRERKGLVMFEPDLTPGTEVQLMRRSIDFNYIEDRAADLFARVGDRKPLFALYVDCAGRASAYSGTEGEEAAKVQQVIGSRVPLLGMYSGVEVGTVGKQAAPQALDWTGVLCLFSE